MKSINNLGEPKFGMVRFYKCSEQYGFIKPDVAGPDVCIHMAEGRKASIGLSGVVFGYGVELVAGGDRVVFWTHPNNPTLVARWAYELPYKMAEKFFELLPEYRIIEQHTFLNESPRSPQVVVAGVKKTILYRWLQEGVVTFSPEEKYHNRTTVQWFERKEGDTWIRCESSEVLGVTLNLVAA